MRGRFFAIIASGATIVLGGCVQATRHSNTMVFGTNTTFGIKVGTTTGEVPEIVVGYDRQEAVIMPLVANSAAKNGKAGGPLEPCDLTQQVEVVGSADYAVHPCSLVGVNGKALDSYSVLASFGAKFVGKTGTTAEASGGLAQYFATGVAAQLLAATGGAAVVAVGNAAAASALKAPPVDQTIESLYGGDAAFKVGRAQVAPFDGFMTRLLAKIDLTPPASLKNEVGAFEAAASSPIKIADSCTDPKICKAAARSAYALGYLNNSTVFEQALSAWKIP